MKYGKRDYFRENADPTVSGFTIMEGSEAEGYRVAEKWESTNRENRWVNYWLDPDELDTRLSEEKCEHVGQVSDDQFNQIKTKIRQRANHNP